MFLAQEEHTKPAHDDWEEEEKWEADENEWKADTAKDVEEEAHVPTEWDKIGVGELVESLDTEEEDFDESLWVKPVDYEDTPAHIPKRRRFEAVQLFAQPKVKSKPEASGGVAREVASRNAEDRQRQRVAAGDDDKPDLPWDLRGPARGADGGGPKHWRGQKWRAGSGRYANAGGKHREKYVVWNRKKAEGLTGEALAFWHPYQKDGHWERQARAQSIASPRDEKEAKQARESVRRSMPRY